MWQEINLAFLGEAYRQYRTTFCCKCGHDVNKEQQQGFLESLASKAKKGESIWRGGENRPGWFRHWHLSAATRTSSLEVSHLVFLKCRVAEVNSMLEFIVFPRSFSSLKIISSKVAPIIF